MAVLLTPASGDGIDLDGLAAECIAAVVHDILGDAVGGAAAGLALFDDMFFAEMNALGGVFTTLDGDRLSIILGVGDGGIACSSNMAGEAFDAAFTPRVVGDEFDDGNEGFDGERGGEPDLDEGKARQDGRGLDLHCEM